MDLVGQRQARFSAIVADSRAFAASIGRTESLPIRIGALAGDNIATGSANLPWYEGPTLPEYLETVELDVNADQARPFRMPVQWVNRPNPEFRGYAGLIASGVIRRGAAIRVLPRVPPRRSAASPHRRAKLRRPWPASP